MNKDTKITYTHDNEKRTNNPSVGIADPIPAKPKKKTYSASLIDGERLNDFDKPVSPQQSVDDPYETPRLEWYLKHETDEFKIDVLPLHVHEKINPSDIIKPLMNIRQTSLFFGEERSRNAEREFYQHEDAWSNRLILGDSLHVMTSLIENEPNVAGHVQMIYYDPPYGINYSSNFQSSFKLDPGNKIEYRPEAIAAFRDTWDYGVHSYLNMIRKQLTIAYEMLADTGSIFLQISKVNVHRVRLILDEVFGADNFMWDITYHTKSGAGSKFPSTCDYILWYAKDKTLLKQSKKLHQLYLDRTNEQMKLYNRLHMPDGSIIKIPKNGKITKGGKLCRLSNLYSQHYSTTDRSNSHTFSNGETFSMSSVNHWMVSHDALDELYKMNRLYFSKNIVSLIVYPDDYPAKLDNVWKGMVILGEKIYDVQTKTTVVERCMLMSSDPGDLVLDMTCGSGVTPYCAEKYGRRWIATDVSKLSISISTTRLQTAIYDWYRLENESKGICGGLKYEEFIKFTADTLSNLDKRKTEYRYQKPLIDKKRLRISGPFTVEQIPSPIIISTKDQIDDSTRKTWADALRTSGVVTNNKNKIIFALIEETKEKDSTIHYIGMTSDNKKYAISFGPQNSPLTLPQVESALRDRRSYGVDGLIFIATIFGTEAKETIWNAPQDDHVFGAEADSDLMIPDLKQKSSDRSFVQIGRPRIDIDNKNESYTVSVKGYDYFDVEHGKLTSEGTDKIAMWMLDTDYDGRTMRPSQMFFPNTNDMTKFAKKLSHTLRDGELNMEKIAKFSGTTSNAFTIGDNRTIAVKTIDVTGREAKYTKYIGEEDK